MKIKKNKLVEIIKEEIGHQLELQKLKRILEPEELKIAYNVAEGNVEIDDYPELYDNTFLFLFHDIQSIILFLWKIIKNYNQKNEQNDSQDSFLHQEDGYVPVSAYHHDNSCIALALLFLAISPFCCHEVHDIQYSSLY